MRKVAYRVYPNPKHFNKNIDCAVVIGETLMGDVLTMHAGEISGFTACFFVGSGCHNKLCSNDWG